MPKLLYKGFQIFYILIYRYYYNIYIIKLLKNIEKKRINNISHEVKKFCLLKRPIGAYNAYGPWALRVGPVYRPIYRAYFPLI